MVERFGGNMDYQGLGAIAEGLKEGVLSYKEAKEKARKEQMDKNLYRLQLEKSGYQEDEGGGLIKRPDVAEREKLDEAVKIGGLLSKGVRADSGLIGQKAKEYGLSYQKPYDEEKSLRMAKLRKDIGGKERLSQSTTLNVQQGAQLPGILKDLEKTIAQNKESFGPFEGRIRALDPYDTKAQAINSQMRAQSQAFGRYMEGGVLRKEDEEKYRKMFPQMSDTPDVAQAKLQNVQRLMDQKLRGDISALRDTGYDISAFQKYLDAPEAMAPEAIYGRGKSPIPQAFANGPTIDPKSMSREEKIKFLQGK